MQAVKIKEKAKERFTRCLQLKSNKNPKILLLNLHVKETCIMSINYTICYPITVIHLLEIVNTLLECRGSLLLNFNIPQICSSIFPFDCQKSVPRDGKWVGQGDTDACFSFQLKSRASRYLILIKVSGHLECYEIITKMYYKLTMYYYFKHYLHNGISLQHSYEIGAYQFSQFFSRCFHFTGQENEACEH